MARGGLAAGLALGLSAVLALVGCAQTAPGGSGGQAAVAAPVVRSAAIPGASLPYIEQGQGPATVVFVHGALSDLRTWAPHLPVVAQRFRAVSYTQRWFGTVSWDPNGPVFGVQTHAQDLAAFIRALGGQPVHLVGWSYGASVVLEAVVRNPELVRSAFVFEPPAPTFVTDKALLARIGQDRAASGLSVAAKAAAEGRLGDAEVAMIDAVAERAGYHAAMPERVRAITRDSAHTLPWQLLRQPPAPATPCDQLGQLKVPVLMARGATSRPMFQEVTDAAARCLPGRKHLVVPGHNHMWPGDDPEGFAKAVLAFVAGQ